MLLLANVPVFSHYHPGAGNLQRHGASESEGSSGIKGTPGRVVATSGRPGVGAWLRGCMSAFRLGGERWQDGGL